MGFEEVCLLVIGFRMPVEGLFDAKLLYAFDLLSASCLFFVVEEEALETLWWANWLS